MKLKPWTITLADTENLHPHEQSIPQAVARIAEDIAQKERFIDPVIVDAETGLVVDGTHRVEAAIRLGLGKIPVYTVDYMSPRVVLAGWGRAASKNISKDELRGLFGRLGFTESMASYDARFIWSDGHVIQVKHSGELSTKQVYEKLSIIDQSLQHLGIAYVRDSDVEELVKQGKHVFGYLLRPLKKEEVVSIVKQGYRLPPKSTRHLIDRRPMYINCPLEILRSSDAVEKFTEFLSEGVWVELGPGAELDRKYDERVMVFYREDLAAFYPEKLLKLVKSSMKQTLR
ncbi:MAG: ParB N-terminal domain-containing protein [Candidatus Caldarchaeum sp.]